MTLTTAALSDSSCYRNDPWTGTPGDGIWDNVGFSGSVGYTIETKVKIDSQASGATGVFSVYSGTIVQRR